MAPIRDPQLPPPAGAPLTHKAAPVPPIEEVLGCHFYHLISEVLYWLSHKLYTYTYCELPKIMAQVIYCQS